MENHMRVTVKDPSDASARYGLGPQRLRDEKLAVADRELIDAAICVMLGKPVPAK
jgi:hypothetical protein